MEKTDSSNLPLLFRPELGPAFVKIVNQLDPVSFTHLAASGKAVRDACFHTKGVCVPFWLEVAGATLHDDKLSLLHWTNKGASPPCDSIRRWSRDQMLEVAKAPFGIHMEYFQFHFPVNKTMLAEIKQHFASINVISIEALHLPADFDYWEDLRQLIKDYCIETISAVGQIPEHVLFWPEIQQLRCLRCYGGVPEEFLTATRIPELSIHQQEISKGTFMNIIEKFLSDSSLASWDVGVSRDVFFSSFKYFTSLPFDFNDELPSDRPLLFNINNDTVILLSSRNTVILCQRGFRLTTLSKCEQFQYPIALKRHFGFV